VLFGMWAWVGPSNHILDGGLDPSDEGAILGWGRGCPIAKYVTQTVGGGKTAGSSKMLFGM